MTTAELDIEKAPKAFTWNTVFKGGAIIDLEIAYWIGAKGLTPADLGIKLSKDDLRALRLGFKTLLPYSAVKPFKDIENKARKVLAQSSFEFCKMRRRFVPIGRIEKTVTTLRSLEAEFELAVENLLTSYTEIRLSQAPVFEDLVIALWKKIDHERSEYASFDEYRDAFMQRLNAAYPRPEALKARYSFRYMVYRIDTPEKESIQEAARITANEESAKVREFYAEVINSARSSVREGAERILEVINSGQPVKGQTLSSLKRIFSTWKTMDFLGDENLLREIEVIERGVLYNFTADDLRNNDGALTAFRDALSKVVDKAALVKTRDFANSASMFTALGVRRFNLED